MYLTRISYNELSPSTHRFLYIEADYRMSFGSIGAKSQNTSGVTNIIDGVSHRSTAEGCDQTGHSGRMSEAGTVVDTVGTQYRPTEFLGYVVVFISAFGR